MKARQRTRKTERPVDSADTAPPEPVARQGICTVCRNAPTCTFPNDPARPVAQCKEFKKSVPLGVRGIDRAEETVARRNRQEAAAMAAEEFMGLCRTCANRHACTFPRQPGGVWHCNEFE